MHLTLSVKWLGEQVAAKRANWHFLVRSDDQKLERAPSTPEHSADSESSPGSSAKDHPAHRRGRAGKRVWCAPHEVTMSRLLLDSAVHTRPSEALCQLSRLYIRDVVNPLDT
jgi:hypothetical protein